MVDEYTSKMLELSSKRKIMLDDGEDLLKEERIRLGIEEYYDMDVLLHPDARLHAKGIIKRYLDHLSVVRSFYSEFHRTFLEEAIEIAHLLTSEERERLLSRTTNGLEENNRIRIRINEIQTLTTHKLQRVIEIFDFNEVVDDQESNSVLLYSDQDIEEYEVIMNDMEKLDNEAVNLVRLQKKRNLAGQDFIARILGFLRNN